MVKITLKDRRLMKNSKVRDYLRKIEEVMAPAVPQIQQAAMDAFVFGQVQRVEPSKIYIRTPLDPRKEAFSALANVKRRVQGTPHQDQRAWDVLAHAVADYVSQGRRETGMWIETRRYNGESYYILKRNNGKGMMCSASSYSKHGECVRMAQKTAKALGIRYKETKA